MTMTTTLLAHLRAYVLKTYAEDTASIDCITPRDLFDNAMPSNKVDIWDIAAEAPADAPGEPGGPSGDYLWALDKISDTIDAARRELWALEY